MNDAHFWNRAAFAYDIATKSGDEGLTEATAYVASFAQENDAVLDAACGTGAFALAAAGRGTRVHASDFSPNMVERAKSKASASNLDNITFSVSDIREIDFPAKTFDLAIAGNVLHLLEQPERALSELQRVTRPGGTIALPTYINAEARNKRFLKLIGVAGFSAVHEWSKQDYIEFLQRAGMHVIEHRMFAAKQPLCVAICRNA